MKKTYYITTPIYYPSDKLHIGHSYTTVAADAIARYKRMQGYDVMFLTGTDEHGQKIEDKAKEAGVTPKAYVDDIVAGIHELWDLMNITHDRFIRTTDPYHERSVQKMFRDLYERGEIYKGQYKGKYCKPCESFWTETQLKDGKCPDCGRDVVDAEEEAYFFKLSNYGDKLIEYYNAHPGFIEPTSRQNEMIKNFIEPGLDDLCVSRTSFSWGIPVDFDQNHVVYVWLDALSNYITALGYDNDEYDDMRYWPADVHLVGKEIVRFHTIIWPAMLMALDLPLPKKVYAHGWVLLDGGKMGKSTGNVVDPKVLCERYGVDAIRYFLLREIPFGNDGNFSNEALIQRINADLANDLGNLVSRTVSMAEKYFGGVLPTGHLEGEHDEELVRMINETKSRVESGIDALQMHTALSDIFALISRANKYIDETMPWVLGKDPEQGPRLAAVLYNLLEVIRVSAILLSPFMPETAQRIFLQVPTNRSEWDDAKYGLLPKNAEVRRGEALFPRIDMDKEMEELQALNPAAEQPTPALEHLPEITFDEFMKNEIRVCKVLQCENVPKSKKLLRFKLFDGERERQILSGIAEHYKPEELIGKHVLAIVNLAPRKMMGEVSEGMILSAELGEEFDLITVSEDIAPGGLIC